MPVLGQLEGAQGEIVGFLRIHRLQHGQAGGHGEAPVVLLVLAGGHARIVGRYDHQPARHAGVGHGEKRIRSHVQAHVLHGDESARTREGCADAHLQRYLFVGRPLGRTTQAVEKLQNLRRRRAWITGAQLDSCLERGQCHGFVATRQSSIRFLLL